MIPELPDGAAPASVRFPARSSVRRYSLRVVLCAVVLGAAAGVAAAALSGTPAPSSAPLAPAAAPLSLDAWLARAATLADGAAPTDPALRDELSRALATGPALAARLLEHYGREPDRRRRGALREFLVGAVPGLDAAARGMVEAGDRVQRTAGFELLAALPASERGYALARPYVFDAQDPGELAAALAALVPVAKPSRREIEQVLPRLVALTRHADAVVHAHAVQRVAEWDLTGALAIPIVQQALADPDPLVRQAAVGAVMIGGLHDAGLKPGLLALVGRRDEALVTRAAVLQALERFPLSDEEHAAYLAGRADVESRVRYGPAAIRDSAVSDGRKK